jgi:ABC-type glycerol-3-phosphate transport system permease component
VIAAVAPTPLRVALRYAALVLVATALLLPIYWLIMSSFRPGGDIFRHTTEISWQTLIPLSLSLEHYGTMLASDIPRAIFNSVFIAVTTVAIGTLVNAMAGFAFAVFEFPFKRVLFALVLLTFMMPFESIVIPLYTLIRTLEWTNTYAALILPEIANGLVVFLFRQFFLNIPREIYEAARVDGAGWWTIFLRLTMPLSGPTIATAALMQFIHQWDAFFWPLVAASTPELVVVQVAIARNITLEQANWGGLFASASTAILLAMIPFLLLQRFYIRTVTASADK